MSGTEPYVEALEGDHPQAEKPEAPRSWDPAGRDVPAAKLDWTECLAFRQVRGIEVSGEPGGSPGERGSFPET